MKRLGKHKMIINRRMNNKGMLDDLFDFLFTIMVSLFLLFFLTGIANRTFEQQKEVTLGHLADEQSQALLLRYLQSPFDKQGNTFATIIIQSQFQPELQQEITTKTETLITLWHDPSFQGITIHYPFAEHDLNIAVVSYQQQLSAKYTMTLPAQEQGITITALGQLKREELTAYFGGSV